MKKNIIIYLLVLTIVFSISVVSAMTVEKNNKSKREKVWEKKCSQIQEKVSLKIKNYDHQKEKHLESYVKRIEKMKEIISRLDDKGYDISKLEKDFTTLDELIGEFKVEYAKFVVLLEETQTNACQETGTGFKDNLLEARKQLKKVHEVSVEIRTFWAKTLKPHILELKDEIKKDEEKDSDKDNPIEDEKPINNNSSEE